MPATRQEVQRLASNRKPDGPYPDFAREVRRLMGIDGNEGREFLTSRMAAKLTGLNHGTITAAVRGERPTVGTCLRLATGLNGDAALLMRLAGFPPSALARLAAQGQGDLSPDEAELVAIFRGVGEVAQGLILSLARTVEQSPVA